MNVYEWKQHFNKLQKLESGNIGTFEHLNEMNEVRETLHQLSKRITIIDTNAFRTYSPKDQEDAFKMFLNCRSIKIVRLAFPFPEQVVFDLMKTLPNLKEVETSLEIMDRMIQTGTLTALPGLETIKFTDDNVLESIQFQKASL
ncbi:hypothetical protein HDV02_003048 [Globomyces sp. JEL0801]|nr:hypothetical protein HDV02_003048 [Globomyces sp. JEL0801]